MPRAARNSSVESNPHTDSGRSSFVVFLAFMMLAAAACAALAIAITTDAWAAWFHHPAQMRPELTRQGAVLWRIMLGISAVALALSPILLHWLSERESAHSRPRHPPLSRMQLWVLIGIVFLALAFRAPRLNESLWYDEIASWMTYTGGVDSAGAIIGNFFDPINHTAHTLLNWISVKLLAESLGVELAFRVPALVFSLLSVLTIFALARAAFGNRVALIAALLAAILPVCVLEGAEARGYSMMICFAALATWLFIEAWNQLSARPWLWVLYALACALGIWSHFVMAFVPIGHAAWLAWRAVRRRQWRLAAQGFVALALGAVLTITLYSPMIPGMLAAKGMFIATSADQPRILGAEGWHAMLQLGGSWSWWAAWPGLALAIAGLIVILRPMNRLEQLHQHNHEAASGRSAIALALLGLPLMVLAVTVGGSWIYARFTLFALPGAVLLIAVGVDSLWRWQRSAAIAALALITAMSLADLVVRPPKQPLREAAEYVRAHRETNDRLLIIGLAHEVMRIYANDLNLTYSLRLGGGADLPAKLQSIHPQWVIVEYPNSVSSKAYQELATNGYVDVARLRGWVDWTNGDLIVYRRK